MSTLATIPSVEETPMLQLLRLEDELSRNWRDSGSSHSFLDWVSLAHPEHFAGMTYLAQLTL